MFCAVITLVISSSLYGQSYNRAVVLRNLEADTVALYPPASGLSSYHLTLPANAPSLGSLWYVADAVRGLGWIAPGNENDVFQVVGGIPSWQNPNSALDDNFVRYNIGTTQSLATTTGGNFLFNVEYGTTNAFSAAGARINSLTTLANSNATGLTLNAAATGVGTSRGLVVTTSGGTSNYAATFNGGNVGIGTTVPSSPLEVIRSVTNSTGTVNTSTIDQVHTIPNSANGFDNHALVSTLTGTVSASSTGGTMTGTRSNAYLVGTGGSVTAADGLAGVLLVGGSASISGYGVGVEGSVSFVSSSNISSLSCLAATSGTGTPLTGTGTITDWNGLRVGNPSGTTTVTNLTGVRIDQLTYAAATSTNAILYNHSTVPFVVKGSGNVGIGTDSPVNRLDVRQTVTANSGTIFSNKTLHTFTPAAGAVSGDYSSVVGLLTSTTSASNSGGVLTATRGGISIEGAAGSVLSARGMVATVSMTGGATATTATGFESGLYYSGTTPAGEYNSFLTGPVEFTGTGTIPLWNGLRIASPIGTTSVTNLTGLRIDQMVYPSAASTNAILYNHATAPFVVKGSGNVGIGVSNPSPRLHVQPDTVTATSSTFGGTWFPYMSIRSLQYVNPASAPAGSFFTTGVANETRIVGSTDMSNTEILGTFALNRNENTNTVHSMRTIQANLNQAATGTVDTGVGVFSDGILSGSGNINRLSNFRGLMNTLTASGTGTIVTGVNLDLQGIIRSAGNITNYYGLYFESPSREVTATGTFTNVTAVHIKDIPSAAHLTGTRRAFYYEGTGSDDPVVITGDGRVGIGDNSTTPATSFDVDGGVVIRPPTLVAVSAAGNITVGNVSYLRLNPTGGAGVNVGLDGGNTPGHILIVEVLDNAANTLTFVDNPAQNLSLDGGNFTPANSATLTFVWNGGIWMELARRTNN